MIKKLQFYILSLILLLITGCSSLGYYLDAVNGHLSILADQESITDILANKSTSPDLKLKLQLATQARDFASAEMLLPENDSYRYYSDIKRPYVVWNVIATGQYSIKAKQWCFLVVGCVSYRGYFSQDDANTYAKELKDQGYDVNVAGAQAYSTLGWFDDPLLNTMINHSDARIVGLIIHELAHQQVYINNDSSFNEAFASTVELEGIKRWFERQFSGSSEVQKMQFQQYLTSKKRESDFRLMLKAAQKDLNSLFESTEFKKSTQQISLKKAVFEQLQTNYQELKKSWNNYSGYDNWMSKDLNNAHLALVATYYDKVPVFQSILLSVDNNLQQFYVAVESIGGLDKTDRNNRLAEYQ